jgi:hypothetical protein
MLDGIINIDMPYQGISPPAGVHAQGYVLPIGRDFRWCITGTKPGVVSLTRLAILLWKVNDDDLYAGWGVRYISIHLWMVSTGHCRRRTPPTFMFQHTG